jgi:hypothetical protein
MRHLSFWWFVVTFGLFAAGFGGIGLTLYSGVPAADPTRILLAIVCTAYLVGLLHADLRFARDLDHRHFQKWWVSPSIPLLAACVWALCAGIGSMSYLKILMSLLGFACIYILVGVERYRRRTQAQAREHGV